MHDPQSFAPSMNRSPFTGQCDISFGQNGPPSVAQPKLLLCAGKCLLIECRYNLVLQRQDPATPERWPALKITKQQIV
jgi:hypothetical protein